MDTEQTTKEMWGAKGDPANVLTRILGWIVGLPLILLGLVGGLGGAAFGWFVVLFGALVFPPVHSFTQRRFDFRLTTGQRALACVLVFACMVATVPDTPRKDGVTTTPQSATVAAPKPQQPAAAAQQETPEVDGAYTDNIAELLGPRLRIEAPDRVCNVFDGERLPHTVVPSGDFAVVAFRGRVDVVNPSTCEVMRTFSDPKGNARSDFGHAISVSGDLLLVGAPGQGRLRPDAGPGCVYLYSLSTGASVWEQCAVDPNNADSKFGSSVLVTPTWIAVGSPNGATLSAVDARTQGTAPGLILMLRYRMDDGEFRPVQQVLVGDPGYSGPGSRTASFAEGLATDGTTIAALEDQSRSMYVFSVSDDDFLSTGRSGGFLFTPPRSMECGLGIGWKLAAGSGYAYAHCWATILRVDPRTRSFTPIELPRHEELGEMFIAPAGNRLFVGRRGLFTPASNGGTTYTSGVIDVIDLASLSSVYTIAMPANIWKELVPREAATARSNSPRDIAVSGNDLLVLASPGFLLLYKNATERFAGRG